MESSQPINEDDLNDLHQDIPFGRPSCGLEDHSERVNLFPRIDIKPVSSKEKFVLTLYSFSLSLFLFGPFYSKNYVNYMTRVTKLPT